VTPSGEFGTDYAVKVWQGTKLIGFVWFDDRHLDGGFVWDTGIPTEEKKDHSIDDIRKVARDFARGQSE